MSRSCSNLSVLGFAASLLLGEARFERQAMGVEPQQGVAQPEEHQGSSPDVVLKLNRYLEQAIASLPNSEAFGRLAALGDVAVPALREIAISQDGSNLQRIRAVEALGEIGGASASAALIEISNLYERSPCTAGLRVALVRSLAATATEQAIEKLLTIAKGDSAKPAVDSEEYAVDALDILQRIRRRDIYEFLWQVAADRERSPDVRRTAALSAMSGRDTLGASQRRLLELCEDLGDPLRLSLLQIGGQAGVQEFVPDLEAGALDPKISSSDRGLSVRALQALGAQSSCARLLSMLESSDPRVVNATLDLFISVGSLKEFSHVLNCVRNNPIALQYFPRETFFTRCRDSIDFLRQNSATLEELWRYSRDRLRDPALRPEEIAEHAPIIAVSLMWMSYTNLTARKEINVEIPLSSRELDVLDSVFETTRRYAVFLPSFTVELLTGLARIYPESFLEQVGDESVPINIRERIGRSIAQSGHAESIAKLVLILEEERHRDLAVELRHELPAGAIEVAPSVVEIADLSSVIDALLKTPTLSPDAPFVGIVDDDVPLEDRMRLFNRLNPINSSFRKVATDLLSSSVLGLRRRAAIRIALETDLCSGDEALSQAVVAILRSDFERLSVVAPDLTGEEEVIADRAALVKCMERLYDPDVCVRLLRRAMDPQSTDKGEVLGLLNVKVGEDEGWERFVSALQVAQSNPRTDPKDAELCDRYVRALKGARKLGMNSPFRFDLDLLEGIIEDNRERASDNRPCAVLCFAESDHNHAGVFFRQQLNDLRAAGFRLLFMEPADEDELNQRSLGLKGLMTASGREGAEIVLVFGHGERTAMALHSRSNDERYSIDISDDGQLNSFGDLLADQGSVVLLSCSTGQGGIKDQNLVEFFRRSVFPGAAPKSIIGPRSPAHLSGIRLIIDGAKGVRVLFPCEQYGG